MSSAASPEAFDVFNFDTKALIKADWLARVVQYPDRRLRVTGRSEMAHELRSRAGTQFGDTASALLSGMSLFMIEDVSAVEFCDGPPSLSDLLGVEDLLLAAAAVVISRRNGPANPASWVELRYSLLRDALGVDLDLLGGEPSRIDALPMTIVVEALAGIVDPFERFMEAPPAVITLYRAHSRPIRKAAADYRQTLLTAGQDALAASCPGVCLRVATDADLYGAGLPRPLPIEDEWS